MSLVLTLLPAIVGAVVGLIGILMALDADKSADSATRITLKAYAMSESAMERANQGVNVAARELNLSQLLNTEVLVAKKGDDGIVSLHDPAFNVITYAKHITTLGQLLALLVNAADVQVEPATSTDSSIYVEKKQPQPTINIFAGADTARSAANDDMVDAVGYTMRSPFTGGSDSDSVEWEG